MSAPLDIEIELIALDQLPAADVARALAALPAQEQARAARYQRAADRAAFASCRMAVRRRLGQLAGVAPSAVPIVADRLGKPRCALDGLPHFSISHSTGLTGMAAVGWCRQELGIDIERVAPPGGDDEGLARLILSAPEQAAYLALPAPRRDDYLMRQFNAREAVLKAMGCGMHVEPHLLRPAGAGFLAPAWDGRPAQQWQACQQDLAGHWLLCAAAQAPALRLRLTWLTGMPLRQSS